MMGNIADPSKDNYLKNGYINGGILDCVRTASKPFIVNGSSIGLPFNLCDIIDYIGKGIIPTGPGLYHLFKDSKLVYVGMSMNIQQRLISHIKENIKDFDNVLWFVADHYLEVVNYNTVHEWEKELIKQHRPILNVTYNN